MMSLSWYHPSKGVMLSDPSSDKTLFLNYDELRKQMRGGLQVDGLYLDEFLNIVFEGMERDWIIDSCPS